MAARRLVEGVYEVGVQHFDRREFDELIPLPDGTSYNSYIVFGEEKTALIDTVDPSKTHVLLENLQSLNVKKIDYIVSNHAEQDHSGSIPMLLDVFEGAKVVTNEKAKGMLQDLLHLSDEVFLTIKEGEELKLGGRTLKFIMTPWVHWPETMSTFLVEDGILFSCDFFGAHLASSELFVRSPEKVYDAAKRYYAEIMMPFRVSIKKNLEKVKALDVKMIAPSHGPVYDDPKFIISAYEEWVSDEVKNQVVIAYVSMHGSTERIVEMLYDELVKEGIEVLPFNLSVSDIGEYAMALVDASALVVASPTVLGGLHPKVAYALSLTAMLRPKLKSVAIVGSFGWGGMMVRQAKELLKALRVEYVGELLIKGLPKDEDAGKIRELAKVIAGKTLDS